MLELVAAPVRTPHLWDDADHEPFAGAPWDERAARAFVVRTVRETDAAYERGRPWPLHPEDREDDECEALRGIYCGSAGTMWALVRLATLHGMPLHHDYGVELARCEARYRADPFETGAVVPSYFLGLAGILTARYAISGDQTLLPPLHDVIASSVGDPAREALWGSSGTAVAALLVRERTRDGRFDDVLRAIQHELWATWEPAGERGAYLWEQDLYDRRRRFVGAAHGAIGNLAPFVRAPDLLTPERREMLGERIVALLETYAIRDDGAANWYTLGDPLGGNRMQWCHGSPGVIMGLARYPANDPRVERLLREGGEGIWRAGPLRKGPALCHGTAGNGFALLRLAHRTGERVWRRRAERFAAHAIAQVAAWRQLHAMPAFSLWTGELGVALFVDALLRDDPDLPSLDVL